MFLILDEKWLVLPKEYFLSTYRNYQNSCSLFLTSCDFKRIFFMQRSGVTYQYGATTGLRLLSTKSNQQTNELVYKHISNNYGGPFASR